MWLIQVTHVISVVILGTLLKKVQCNIPFDFKKYYEMPELDQVDDYDRCLDEHQTDYVYCIVEMTIRPDNKSALWKYIEEYSRDYAHNFEHNRLRRGICVNWCNEEIAQLNDTTQKSYNIPQFPEIKRYPPQKFRETLFYGGHEYIPKYGRTINICMNKRLADKNYNLLAYSAPEICMSHEEDVSGGREIDELDYLFVGIIAFLMVALAVSSVSDFVIQRRHESEKYISSQEHYTKPLQCKIQNTLVAFSVFRNWKTLVAPRPHGDYKIMHVLRFFFCIMVLFGHVLAFYIQAPVTNKLFVEQNTNNFNSVFSAAVMVHSFYVMTGFIVSFKFFEYIEKNPEFHFSKLVRDIINRLARILPLYVFWILFAATWFQRLGSGPIWKAATEVESTMCRENWWTNLLFINNYVRSEEPCFLQTFFLAVDFQMLIVALIMLSIVWKYPKSVNYVFGVAMLYSVLSVAINIYVRQFDGTIVARPEDMKYFMMYRDMYQQYYIPTHVNTGNYVWGMIGGYIYFQLRRAKIDLADNKLFEYIWYPLPLTGLLIIAFSGSIYTFYDFPKPNIWIAIHATVLKNGWGFFYIIGMLGFLFHLGGIVREVFHHRIFLILGRLTYGVYLNHTVVMRYFQGTKRIMEYASYAGIITTLVYTAAFSFAIAAGTAVVIEYPFTHLFNVILNKNKTKSVGPVEPKYNNNDVMIACLGEK